MSPIQAGTSRAPIAEGDPLPPDDAVPIGHRPSIDAVYRETRPRLFRFLVRRNRPEDAEDIVQQSFVRVLAKQVDDETRIVRFDNYLFRVARNLTIDQAKTARNRNYLDQVPIEDIERISPELLEAPDQVAALEARDMLNRLEAVMQRMKPRTREIFLAHRIDGYSYGEIAVRTGLSVKGVEKHMSRAIATIDRNMRYR